MKDIEQLGIGEKFKVNGVEYKVVETESGCGGCCFEYPVAECTDIFEKPYCHIDFREDEKDVIFIKV